MSLSARVKVVRDLFTLDVDITVADGEIVAVLGPNGAGKTTLLRALAGLTALTAGKVELVDRILEDPARALRLPPEGRGVGMVFQDYRLFPHLSARDNIAFGPRSTGMSARQAGLQADDWLDRLGLAGLAERRPAQLSGGQAQRVALARALVTAPSLLLLDEPLAALDAATRTDVRAALRTVLDDFAGPVLLVTHDPLDAMTLASRLVIIEDGRVVQDGSVALVAERPATTYVAQLVGLTVWHGTAVDGVLDVGDGVQLVTADTERNGPTIAVIRPSAVLVSVTAPTSSSARNVWPRRVQALQALGDRVRITFSGEPPLHADITAAAAAQLRLAAADAVWASVKATDIITYPDPLRFAVPQDAPDTASAGPLSPP